MKQWFKEFIHNCIVHPLMMVLPSDKATRLHDIHANYAFGLENRYDELFLETGYFSLETILGEVIHNSANIKKNAVRLTARTTTLTQIMEMAIHPAA